MALRLQSKKGWLGALVALGVCLVLLAPIGLAQGPTPTLQEINDVARELYCPLCNGVRLDTCDLLACIQMREVISDKLAAGVDKEQIKQDFVDQYGPVVLGEPPRRGVDLIAWILAPAAILIGGGWLLYTLWRWTQRPAEATAGAPPPDLAASPPGAAEPVDDYLARVEADLAELE